MQVHVSNLNEPIQGYRLLEPLGRGGFGEVWKCEAPGGLLKAIKIVHGSFESAVGGEEPVQKELRSLNCVKSVRHPFILSLDRYEVVSGQLLIVMELADRSLWDRFEEAKKQGLPGIPREELLHYLTEAAEALSPGKIAVIAEIAEEWVTPLDTRMETLGGTVIRQPRAEFIDAQIERETVARKAELAQLKAERDHAIGEAKAKLQAKVEAAQRALREESARLKEKIAAGERERQAKIEAITAQAAHASGEIKEKIQKRIADSQARHEVRKEKLSQAWQLVKEAAAA